MTTVRNSIPRLRSVRFKDGRAPLRIFRAPATRSDQICNDFIEGVSATVEQRPEMDGFAIVAWAPDGSTSVLCRTAGNAIPTLLLPEFVKTCVEDWLFRP